MGILDFVKEAGQALLGSKAQAAEPPPPGPDADAANRTAAEAIENYIKTQNLDATGLTVTFDGASRTVTVFGVAADQATKEKILLCCGNVKGGRAGRRQDVGVDGVCRGDLSHRREWRHALSHLEEGLRRRQQVQRHLRGEQADAFQPGQDLPGAGAAHSAGLT